MKREKLKQNDTERLNFIYDGKYVGNGCMIFIPTFDDITNKRDINLLIKMGSIFHMDNGTLNIGTLGRLQEGMESLYYLIDLNGEVLLDAIKTNRGVERAPDKWTYVFEDSKANVWYFDAHYVKIMESHYPNATYKTGVGKLYIYNDDKIVGTVMCVNL